MTRSRLRVHPIPLALGCVLAAAIVQGCGKKGPPLAPLHLVPVAPDGLSLVRRGTEVRLRFTLPTANSSGRGRIDLDRMEIYAVTVAPDAAAPSNAMLLTKKYLAGTIKVKPLPEEGAPPAATPPGGAPDTRPSPGEAAAFTEQLTPDKLTPAVLPKAPPAPPPAAGQPAAASPAPSYARRIYVVRGFTRGGRPGAPSGRVSLPLAPLPAPPSDLAVHYTETALSLEWKPPASDEAGRTLAFNVYRKGTEGPLNSPPLPSPKFERSDPEFGNEQCYSVRAVVTAEGISIESDPSAEQCVTPRDTFPPAVPKGLAAVAVPGEIDLIWDANTEPDLAGYVVLRGEAPGDKLLPLMTAPIADTKFADKTVKPGVRYVYALVAADKSSNVSPQSPHIEETAR